MNTIDHKNIDEWLFNYFEGNLNPQESETLTRFLNANPALKADYDAWKASYVSEVPVAYPNAGELLQPVPASAIKKWIGWGLALLLALSLLVFFPILLKDQKELPAEPAKELPAASEDLKKMQAAPPSRPEEETKANAIRQKPEHTVRSVHTGKDIYRKSTEVEPSETTGPFLMQRQVDVNEILSNNQSPSSDSLEIIVMPQPVSHPAGKSSKRKTRKKPMTVIRIRDTGF